MIYVRRLEPIGPPCYMASPRGASPKAGQISQCDYGVPFNDVLLTATLLGRSIPHAR